VIPAGPAAFREAVCRAVAQVPRGTVATYGQIAWMAGYPRRPRQVGMVLKGLPEGNDLPWHRIVNANGYVPSRGRWWGAMLQIQRLRQEGVEVDAVGNLDLRRYQWRGGDVDEPR
jgi:methylated-DNA-protein-cysteine methyltransferase-like protein